MCTALTMPTLQEDIYFGRSMDFSYPLEPELFVVPRGYTWNNILNTHKITNHYSFIGIGQDINPIVFADGVNEMGFSAAVLYFPGYAEYDQPVPKTPSIAALELVSFMLGLCASADQAVALLKTIRIVGVTDSVTQSVAPLHWIIADKSGKCMVIEKTAEGLQIIDNPLGVLANSPDFQWHMTNLRNYLNVTPEQYPVKMWDTVGLTPFGQGGGTFGLPGDFTPPSRFVRTAYLKTHTELPLDPREAVVTGFHILESVSIPKGVVLTNRGASDYTQYTAFMNLNTQEYFFRTYDNSEIMTAKLPDLKGKDKKVISLGKLSRPILFPSLNQQAQND